MPARCQRRKITMLSLSSEAQQRHTGMFGIKNAIKSTAEDPNQAKTPLLVRGFYPYVFKEFQKHRHTFLAFRRATRLFLFVVLLCWILSIYRLFSAKYIIVLKPFRVFKQINAKSLQSPSKQSQTCLYMASIYVSALSGWLQPILSGFIRENEASWVWMCRKQESKWKEAETGIENTDCCLLKFGRILCIFCKTKTEGQYKIVETNREVKHSK